MESSLRMITLKKILSQICPGDWFMSMDLKGAYFHIQIASHPRQFLRFTFEGVAYQYKVLPFGLSLATCTFTWRMDAAHSPLRQMGIRILNYLDDCLILTHSQVVLTSHKTLLLSHLGCLGLRVNFAKSILLPSQRVSFLGTVINSVQMTTTVSAERATTIQRHTASFEEGTARPLKAFWASHATYPVLAEAEGSIRDLASRTPPRNGDSGLCVTPGPLERPLLAKAICDLRYGAQKEGWHDRRFQQGLGSAVRRQTDLRSLIREGVGPAHQLSLNSSSVPGLSILPAGNTGTPCASMLRQQIRGVIHKSPGRPRFEVILHGCERPSCVGSEQSALTEGDACAGQNEPRSRHVVKEQCLFRGMDAPPVSGSENLGSLWQNSSRPLCLRRQLSLPNLFDKEHGCPGPRVAQSSALCFSLQSLYYRRYSGESGNNGTISF